MSAVNRVGWRIVEEIGFWSAVVGMFTGRMDFTTVCIGLAIYAKLNVRELDRELEKKQVEAKP